MGYAYILYFSLYSNCYYWCYSSPAILGSGFPNPDNIVSTLSTNYAPTIISFLSLLCLFAFGVSTADSLLLSASAMASRDIYIHHAYERKNKIADPKKAVWFARIVLLGLMVITLIIVAFKPASITDYAYKLSSPFFAQILPQTIGGLFWKRSTKEGAFAGTISGLIVAIIFTFFIAPPFGFSALIWALLANSTLFILVSLATKCPENITSKFHDRINSIIYSGAEVSSVIDNTIEKVVQK